MKNIINLQDGSVLKLQYIFLTKFECGKIFVPSKITKKKVKTNACKVKAK